MRPASPPNFGRACRPLPTAHAEGPPAETQASRPSPPIVTAHLALLFGDPYRCNFLESYPLCLISGCSGTDTVGANRSVSACSACRVCLLPPIHALRAMSLRARCWRARTNNWQLATSAPSGSLAISAARACSLWLIDTPNRLRPSEPLHFRARHKILTTH